MYTKLKVSHAQNFILSVVIGLSVFASSGAVVAAQAPVQADVVSCFDYYRFGSVQVTGELPSVVRPGETVMFEGDIANANAYPVVDVAIYAKVFRAQSDSTLRNRNGDFLVDQFFAVEKLSIDAKASKPIQFNWTAPKSMVAGGYNIAFYVVSANRFNLGGLTFTDDVISTRVFFTVQNLAGATTPIEWDKNSVTLNGAQHDFAKPLAVFDAISPVVLSAPLHNPTNQPQEANITWTTYNWDGLRNENILETKTESVTVQPNASKVVTHTISDARGPVTYITAQADAMGGRSIIDVRFAREGYVQTRLNSSALSQFPITEGTPVTVYACAHSASPEDSSGGQIQLELRDNTGTLIHSAIYDGPITSAMMAAKTDFVATKNINDAILTATLLKDGIEVDSVMLHYKCADIDNTACIVTEEVLPKLSFIDVMLQFININVLAVASVLLLLLTLYWRRIRRNDPLDSVPPTLPMSALFLILCGGLMVSPFLVHAGSVSWTSPSYYSETFDDGLNPETNVRILSRVDSMIVTVGHSTSASVPDGTTVRPGDVIRVTVPFDNTDINWFASGSYQDSPYGFWDSASGLACDLEHRFNENRLLSNGALSSRVVMGSKVVIAKPLVTMTGAGMNCIQESATNAAVVFACTITQATTGDVTGTVHFAGTTGTANLERATNDLISGGVSPTYTRTGTGGTGGGCFTAGTQVTMADGTQKNIELVTADERLMTSSGPQKIEKLFHISYKGDLYAFNGDGNYFVTDTHPFMTTEGWKSFNPEGSKHENPGLEVTRLSAGDTILHEDGGRTYLSRVDKKYAETMVYNFKVPGSNDFYANGFWVHNVAMKDEPLP